MVKKIKKKLKKKLAFFFGKNRKAKFFFRKSFSNIFITLTDLRSKVVFSLSSGMCVIKNNKRLKTAPFIIEIMADKLIKILHNLKINTIEIIMRTAMRVHLRIFVFKLMRANFNIIKILDKRIAAHNGVRGRSVKRR